MLAAFDTDGQCSRAGAERGLRDAAALKKASEARPVLAMVPAFPRAPAARGKGKILLQYYCNNSCNIILQILQYLQFFAEISRKLLIFQTDFFAKMLRLQRWKSMQIL